MANDPYLDTTRAWDEDEHPYPDVCVHGRGFDEVCVECCPEDDDGLLDD